ncbi:MAG: BspA family leucine-rich repeat surface protein [Clostridia bacterium]|nr:BspA family leucine-rich repeat surface protein [Clostridia bacterium]
MLKESTLFFRDAAGKFNAVKEEAHDACRYSYDLTVYSLTPSEKAEPAYLIVRMMPVGTQDSYLSARRPDVKEANVSMLLLNYRTFPAGQLSRIIQTLKSNFRYKDSAHGYIQLCRCDESGGHEIRPVSAADFFSVTPRTDIPGAQIYLRDKSFILSLLGDPKKPDFSALSLLTADQKAEAASIGLSRADVRGRYSLARLFDGYKSISHLDLSAFDTSGAGDMQEMFRSCENLRRLDLSSFDFSRVKWLKDMFSRCPNLEEVILSDTILGAGQIPHRADSYPIEYLNELYKSEYISSGPNLAEMAAESASKKTDVLIGVPFHQATEEEIRRHLGFSADQPVKLVIVPHQRPKSSAPTP